MSEKCFHIDAARVDITIFLSTICMADGLLCQASSCPCGIETQTGFRAKKMLELMRAQLDLATLSCANASLQRQLSQTSLLLDLHLPLAVHHLLHLCLRLRLVLAVTILATLMASCSKRNDYLLQVLECPKTLFQQTSFRSCCGPGSRSTGPGELSFQITRHIMSTGDCSSHSNGTLPECPAGLSKSNNVSAKNRLGIFVTTFVCDR